MAYRRAHVPDLRRALENLRDVARETTVTQMVSFADAERSAFIRRVEAQKFASFAAFPLSPRWLRRKELAGADLRTMIATHWYLDNVRIEVVVRGGKVMVHVGFDSGVMAKDLSGDPTDIELDAVAKIQEYGSQAANIPPRPHWRPHLADMKKRAARVRRTTRKSIAKAMRKAH